MLYLGFRLHNPLPHKQQSKSWIEKSWRISQNKALEIELCRWDYNWTLIGATFDLTIYGTDHAGLNISFELWGMCFNFNFYDVRHWDYDNNKWEEYNETMGSNGEVGSVLSKEGTIHS